MLRTRAAAFCALVVSAALAGPGFGEDPPAEGDAAPTVTQSPRATRDEKTAAGTEGANPPPLRRPVDTPAPAPEPLTSLDDFLLQTSVEPPLGFAGRSSVLPSEVQETSHFVPMEDRWRLGFPDWDRYGKGHPRLDDYPYVEGNLWNPYKQNVLKGDYPIIGQNTFLEITASSVTFVELRQVPTGTTPFESTQRPFEEEFFGRPGQYFVQQNFILSLDLFHGDAAFKPVDWRVKLTPIFNVNSIDVNELAVVNPNVLKGTTRGRTFFSLEEYFVETKLADLSPYYDFMSLRLGSQPFNFDFRGFLFDDINRGVRLFGTRLSNRDQFNVVYFRQAEKDTNSELNTFDDRGQDLVMVNYFREDFIWPGYTAQVSFLYDHDQKSFHFDKNDILVRPDPVGIFKPHELNVFYLGWAGDGHINRLNITHQFYWALGTDSLNPLANSQQDINAQMAAVELSYDRDWARFRTSVFWASGDDNILNRHATGFDAPFDNPNFAGGQFSYWQRQAIRLFGVNLKNRGSLLPDLRSSKIDGQANFVNPGVFLYNLGLDLELTPKLRMINNVNFLWFDETAVLEQFTFDGRIHHFIGVDPSVGFEYRPFLNNNVIMTLGFSGLFPGAGFRDLYDKFSKDTDPLGAAFVQLNLNF
jgi:hypothetical protein